MDKTFLANQVVGKRYLLTMKEGYGRYGDVQEFKVLEISPSGNWIKLMNGNGVRFWKAMQDISYVEELKDLKISRLELPEVDESLKNIVK